MKIYINKGKTVRNIQEEFNAFFPFLKIEFYRKQHQEKMLSPKEERVEPYISVFNLMKDKSEKTIIFQKDISTSAFEKMMAEAGLFVQVFRKSGRIWLQTSRTDDWTLEQQNAQGGLMTDSFQIIPENV